MRSLRKDYIFYFAVRLNNLKKKSLLNICEVQSGPHPAIQSSGVTESLTPYNISVINVYLVEFHDLVCIL